jgi:hypothetical protein
MTDARVLAAVEESIIDATGEIPDGIDVGIPLLPSFARSASLAPPWWSFDRDAFLRNFWKKSSHLSMMVYTGQNMLVNTPMRVVPKDPSIVSHSEQAEMLTYLLMNVSEFGESMLVAKTRFVEDYLTQDNGGFMEVIGPGDPAGPIEGLPHAVRHLDSRYCWRTGNPIYPVVYHDPHDGGKGYALHRTRVIYMSQMTSSDAERNGVGFCAVSRSLQFAQHLYDIMIHKQEKLGSRPISQILVGAGFRGSHIMQAVSAANKAMTNQSLSRYARVIGIGSDDVNAKLDVVSLNNFDPFDEETSVTFAMYGLAAAFGIPIQEVWPTSGGKSGRGGDMQESRQRGKLPAEFHSELDQQLSQKYLPGNLEMVSDWSDDYQDEREAINEDIRARNRERDLGTDSITVRTAREQMAEKGDLTRGQLRTMELEDGRLENGSHVSVLFYYEGDPYKTLLDLGVEYPTAMRLNDKEEMLKSIDEQVAKTLIELARTTAQRERRRLEEVLAALKWLEDEYFTYEEPVSFEDMARAPGSVATTMGKINDAQEAADGDEDGEEEEGDGGGGSTTRTPNEMREGTLTSPQNPKEISLKQSSLDDLLDDLEDDLQKEFAKEEPSESRLKEIVLLAFLLFYLEGAQVESDSLTEAQQKTVSDAQKRFSDSIPTMLDRKANGNDMQATVEKVSNHAKSLYWIGFVNDKGAEDEEVEWFLGATEVHCGDCSSFAGKKKTRKEWREGGLLPQSPGLECTGRYCDCSLA